MTAIVYVKGDATVPQAKGKKIIAHICNDIGRWGKGFVLAISARWNGPEAEYRVWHQRGDGFALGAIQLVRVESWIWVAGSNGPPIRYDAVESCLKQLAVRARDLGASVHMPRIGCGLAGGTWEEIEPIIQRTLIAADVAVHVYDYDGK
jgi:O-acetyl-ADP-ribose deacetylase (regulator of RNase III)